jgi:hypothetical protein
MKTFEIAHVASSVSWWLNYISSVGRNYIISESALKIPLTEYLEKSAVENIELEFNHPLFEMRRFDLHFKDSSDKLEKAFEFKYVKEDSTRSVPEKKRVFNDLMRLHFYMGAGKKVYFLICGNQDSFSISFEKLPIEPPRNYGTPKQKNVAAAVTLQRFYSEWFSFDLNNPTTTIDLTKKGTAHEEMYTSFESDYAQSYKNATNGKVLSNPASIKTQLVFLSEQFTNSNIPQTIRIGIWEVIP